MKQLKKNISNIIGKEYRKRYYYSINYYNISKISPLFSNSEIISIIKYRFREFKYEYDDKEYIITINFKSIIIRTMIKLIIFNNPSLLLYKIFPNYFCYEGKFFNIMQNHIKTKMALYKKIYNSKENKGISNEIENESIKDNEISIIQIINDDKDNNDESKYKDKNNYKEETNKQDSMKSLLSLTKKMIKNKDKNKYNRIKELFLDNDNLKFYTKYSAKDNLVNIKFFHDRKRFNKRKSSLPGIPSSYLENRILKTKTEKNIFKFFGGRPLQVSELINRNNNKLDNKSSKSLKILKRGKYNKNFVPISYFNYKIKEKKEKIKNLKNILNNCEINIKYDNNQNADEMIIKNNRISILKKEDNIQLIKKQLSKKCKKELNYDELTYYGIMGKNRKLVKTEMVNKIIKLTSKNSYNINLFHSMDKKSKIFHINKNNNNTKTLTKNLSIRNNSKNSLKHNHIFDLKRYNKKYNKCFSN